MRRVMERAKLVIEPSAAVIFAALKIKISQLAPSEVPRHVGLIVCGGNVDLDKLPELMD